jgi:tetratricopeptide (TPR) repeat protein
MPDTDVARANSFYQRGLFYYRQSQWTDASNVLQDAVDIYPDHALARMYLGAALAQQKLYLDAIMLLEQGRQSLALSDLMQFRYAKLLGTICLSRHDYPAAIYYLELAVNMLPHPDGDPQLLQLFAVASCKGGDFGRGFDLFMKVRDIYSSWERRR